jgi:hypothetical protein
VSSVGKSGGLLVAWNPNLLDLQPFLCVGGILLTGVHIPDKRRISLINVYGPCSGRRLFWENLEASGLLDLRNLIIAGDFNFTTGSDEVWGASALLDSQAVFFRDLFLRHHLIDVKPAEVVPTWRNCRMGTDNISKRLDRVYASDEFLNDSLFSDHGSTILTFPTMHQFFFNWIMGSSLCPILLSLIRLC